MFSVLRHRSPALTQDLSQQTYGEVLFLALQAGVGVEAAGGEVTPLLNAEDETPAVRGRLGPSSARPGHTKQKGQGGFHLSADDTFTHSLSREQVSHCGGSPTLVGTAGEKSWKSTVPDHLHRP